MPTTSKYFLHCKKKKKSQDWKQESRWVVYDTAAASGRVSCFYSWLWKRVVLQDNVRRLVHRGFEIIQGGNQKVLSPVWFWREKMKNVFTGRWWQWSSGTLVVSESAGNRNKACSTLLKTFLFYLRFVFAYFKNVSRSDQTEKERTRRLDAFVLILVHGFIVWLPDLLRKKVKVRRTQEGNVRTKVAKTLLVKLKPLVSSSPPFFLRWHQRSRFNVWPLSSGFWLLCQTGTGPDKPTFVSDAEEEEEEFFSGN